MIQPVVKKVFCDSIMLLPACEWTAVRSTCRDIRLATDVHCMSLNGLRMILQQLNNAGLSIAPCFAKRYIPEEDWRQDQWGGGIPQGAGSEAAAEFHKAVDTFFTEMFGWSQGSVVLPFARLSSSRIAPLQPLTNGRPCNTLPEDENGKTWSPKYAIWDVMQTEAEVKEFLRDRLGFSDAESLDERLREKSEESLAGRLGFSDAGTPINVEPAEILALSGLCCRTMQVLAQHVTFSSLAIDFREDEDKAGLYTLMLFWEPKLSEADGMSLRI